MATSVRVRRVRAWAEDGGAWRVEIVCEGVVVGEREFSRKGDAEACRGELVRDLRGMVWTFASEWQNGGA